MRGDNLEEETLWQHIYLVYFSNSMTNWYPLEKQKCFVGSALKCYLRQQGRNRSLWYPKYHKFPIQPTYYTVNLENEP